MIGSVAHAALLQSVASQGYAGLGGGGGGAGEGGGEGGGKGDGGGVKGGEGGGVCFVHQQTRRESPPNSVGNQEPLQFTGPMLVGRIMHIRPSSEEVAIGNGPVSTKYWWLSGPLHQLRVAGVTNSSSWPQAVYSPYTSCPLPSRLTARVRASSMAAMSPALVLTSNSRALKSVSSQ